MGPLGPQGTPWALKGLGPSSLRAWTPGPARDPLGPQVPRPKPFKILDPSPDGPRGPPRDPWALKGLGPSPLRALTQALMGPPGPPRDPWALKGLGPLSTGSSQ